MCWCQHDFDQKKRCNFSLNHNSANFYWPKVKIDKRQKALHWRQNGCDGVSSHRRLICLLTRLFRRRSKKQQSSASLAFVRGIHGWPVDSPHKGPITRKCFHLMTSSWKLGSAQSISYCGRDNFSLSWPTWVHNGRSRLFHGLLTQPHRQAFACS